MNTIERRLVEGMTSRGFSEEAREEILRGITSFALYGFPESHAASFALIAYASAYLKCHHPAAFLAGLLNAQPMGFYSPATLVKDAQRHGVEVRAIDPTRSDWRCTLESPRFETHVRRHPRGATQPDEEDRNATHRMAVRVGLRHVTGLRKEAGLRIAAERRRAPFATVADLAQRAALRRTELDALAELGALAALAEPNATPHGRRSALWQVAAIERDPNSLFADVSPADDPSPLIEMNDFETTLADYRHSGLTLGPHPLQHLRADLARRGVLSAAQLRDVPDGKFVRTAGHAIVRQRPGTAKGFCFLTLEDETGTSNAILTPSAFRRFRVPLHAAAILEIAGPLQNLDGVIHVRVRELRPLAHRREFPHSHDYR
jgi:error-prone DNA polymerase